MFLKVILLVALAAVAMSAPTPESPTTDLLVGPVDFQQEWTKWKKLHSKSYDTPEEDTRRQEIFKENLNKIIEHNKKYQAGEVTWSQGLNKFADLNQEEFSNTYLMKPGIARGLSGIQ